MAGRGRGKAALSFTAEQIGIAPGEALPGPVLQPPPLFPVLEFHPAELDSKPEYVQRLKYKKELRNYFNGSSLHVRKQDISNGTNASNESKGSKKAEVVTDRLALITWDLFPSELRPSTKKASVGGTFKKPNLIKRKTQDLTWLDTLAKKEELSDSSKGDNPEDPQNPKDEDKNEEEEEVVEDEEIDEEMDDGTDYNENYFDNGEGYLDDEDDNLDDGPIY